MEKSWKSISISPVRRDTGFTSRKVNGNEYTTNGVEIMVGASPLRKKEFRWDINLNWDTRVKKLTSIYGGAPRYGNYSVGVRVDNYYGTVWMKGICKIEVSAYGYNLFILKKAMIIDPDYGNDNNLQYPSARYFGLGTKITF